MNIVEIVLLAISLSMDAFAVALCKGLALKKINLKSCAIVGLWFGAFQGLMPMLGYFLGSTFADKITSIDHWIASILLAIIGGNMIKEALEKDEEKVNDSLGFKTMLVMAIATSIDALAVGISLAMAGNVNIWEAVILIGVITFSLSAAGVKIGNVFGSRFEKKAQIAEYKCAKYRYATVSAVHASMHNINRCRGLHDLSAFHYLLMPFDMLFKQHEDYVALYEAADDREKPDFSLYYAMLAFIESETAKLESKLPHASDWEAVELTERMGGFRYAQVCLDEAWQKREVGA